MSPQRIKQLPLRSSLSTFHVSQNGFLPELPPLPRLPHEYYSPWETILDNLPSLIRTQELRSRVDALPVLQTHHLKTEPEWRRAYSALAYLAQGYIWQGDQPSERLPPAITVPFLAISARLETQPTGCYTAYNLWNWAPIDASRDIRQPDNLRAINTITGTDDENWFLMVSNAMEARAGPMVEAMLQAMGAIPFNDFATVTASLQYFREEILEMAELVDRMDDRCDPQVFYHRIRPLLAGSMNMEAAGLPKGIFYDEGNGKGSWRKFRGGSNGQSSLIQFFDVVLGVDHVGTAEFHNEMREYMPGPHARFLISAEQASSIRQFVVNNSAKSEKLARAYNAAVEALGHFRDRHIQLVTRYVIIPSRNPLSSKSESRNLAVASTAHSSAGMTEELVGTGGTKLVPFLRQSRDETSATKID